MREDWQTVKLGEVCEVNSGATFPKKHQGLKDEQFPFYKVSDMNLLGNEVQMTSAKNTISDSTRQNLRAKIFTKGCIIFPKVGAAIATNKKRLVTISCCVDNNVMGLFPNLEAINENYLYYYMLSFEIYDWSNKSNPPSIRKSTVEASQIPLPPLAEQERIVSILDKAFEGIDKAIAQTEQNLASARELFESYLNNIFTQKGDDWVEKKLGDECTILMGQSPKGDSYNDEGIGVPLINGPVEFGGIDPFAKTKATKFTTSPTKLCKKGDVILCVRGSTTGRMNIAGHDACVGRGVAALRSEENHEWIKQFISFSREIIYKLGSGATFPNVSSQHLKNILIRIPPENQRDGFVEGVEKLKQQTIHLEALYTQKLNGLKELKQSLLQQAFAGELTKEDAA